MQGYLERVCDCPIVEGLKFVVVGLDIPAVKALKNAKRNFTVSARVASCKNTWESYECSCGDDNMLYMREHDTCISE
ncbi:vacuolar-sorting receptor 4-like isoform X4 [Miscanthus floridulus]|uniref:vacuolar-sorting receptor 4-like isoform X4 n=1 Tax=Miscanthus floridulus TaxID=154761 RepID=UPI003457AE74